MQSRVPDVLVLGGGTILGEAWMSGFLAGAQRAWDIHCRNGNEFVDTSAGVIVAAQLATGIGHRAASAQEPVRRAQADVTVRDLLMARFDRAIQEWGDRALPGHRTGHRGRHAGGASVSASADRSPDQSSAGITWDLSDIEIQ